MLKSEASVEVDKAVDTINQGFARTIKFLNETVDSSKYSWKIESAIAKTHVLAIPVQKIYVSVELKGRDSVEKVAAETAATVYNSMLTQLGLDNEWKLQKFSHDGAIRKECGMVNGVVKDYFNFYCSLLDGPYSVDMLVVFPFAKKQDIRKD